jgi:hypothetical protein
MAELGALRVLTILARHGDEQYPDAQSRIDGLFAKGAPGVARRTVVVDNALSGSRASAVPSGPEVIAGSNDAYEFSAWDAAVTHVGRELDSFDVIHLATSAFGMLHTAYLERFDERLLRLVGERPIATGHVDYYPYPVAFGARVSQHWLRTSFLFVAPREIRALRTLVSYRDRASIFTGDPKRPFRPDGPVSPGYVRLILDWLTSPEGTGQGVAWHSRIDLSEETLPRFEGKALAILNEHALSARLRAQGCAVVDISHLALLLARETVPRRWPAWRSQVTDRAEASHPYPAARPFA